MEQIEEKEIRPYDVIVIGAGAAGMMAAGTAARDGKRVLLIEKMDKSGRKVRITGKGRCNLTNDCDGNTFLTNVPTNPRFLYGALAGFPTGIPKPFLRGLAFRSKPNAAIGFFRFPIMRVTLLPRWKRNAVKAGLRSGTRSRRGLNFPTGT